MVELERIAFIVKPTQLMYDWIQTLTQDSRDYSLADLRQDCTVLLLPQFKDDDEAWDYFEGISLTIFENELAAWTLDEDKWPAERSQELFYDWFEIEQHNPVVDLAMADKDI